MEAVFTQPAVVLDSDAANTRQIDPRFNGKAHPCFQLLLASRLQIHRLMDLHPNPVTQAVGKVLPVARFFDNPTGHLVPAHLPSSLVWPP